MNKLIIIGAGGHGKVAAETAELLGYTEIAFLDDNPKSTLNIIGKVCDYPLYKSEYSFFVAIGDNTTRQKILSELLANQVNVVSLVHPNATVSKTVKIAPGTIIMAGAVVNADTKIGTGVIINTCSSVDHDSIIGSYTHVAVGAHLAGTVTLGDNVLIASGATVINNITICSNTIVGAGAVVLQNITTPGTYIGLPAKELV